MSGVDPYKVCVFGAGAIGGHLAARLARGGAEVSLVARGPHLAAIQARGLEVRAADGVHQSRPKASADPRDLGPQDMVVVTLKAPALPALAASVAPLLGPDTAVAFIMNGMPWWYFDHHGGPLDGRRLPELDPGDAVRRAIGIGRTLGGTVYSACSVVEPGVIASEHGAIRVMLGEPDGRITPRAERFAATLSAGGMPCHVVPDIRREVWIKLLGNLSSGTLCLLSGHGLRDTLADPAIAEAARRIRAEGAAIAAALGIELGPPPAPRGPPIAHKPSILQDLELGRPMELAAINEVPQALARELGVPTPTLDLTLALARLQVAARMAAPGAAGSVPAPSPPTA